MPERIKVVNHLHRGAPSFFQPGRFTMARLIPRLLRLFHAETLEFRVQKTIDSYGRDLYLGS